MSLDDIHLFDPFDPLSDLSKLIDPPETYTIRRYNDLGASWYGIQLKRPPAFKDLPSSVTDPFSVTQRRILVVRTSDNFVFSEVSFTTGPSSGQFRADYYNVTPLTGVVLSNYQSTGLLQFSASNDGEEIDVYYWETGLGLLPQNYADFLASATIPGDLTVDGVLTADSLVAPAGTITTLGATTVNATDLNVSDDLVVGDDAAIAGLATIGETLSVTGASTFTGGFKTEGSDLFLVKKVDIGSWDMDATASVNITHGISSAILRIVNVCVLIIQDGGSLSTPIQGSLPDGSWSVQPSTINITRVAGGLFDSTSYNDTGINRGYIYIVYMV